MISDLLHPVAFYASGYITQVSNLVASWRHPSSLSLLSIAVVPFPLTCTTCITYRRHCAFCKHHSIKLKQTVLVSPFECVYLTSFRMLMVRIVSLILAERGLLKTDSRAGTI
jgi:hypothetical protein